MPKMNIKEANMRDRVKQYLICAYQVRVKHGETTDKPRR